MNALAGFSYPPHGRRHCVRIKTGERQKLREVISDWAYFHLSDRLCSDDLCQQQHCTCEDCTEEFNEYWFQRQRAKDDFLFEQRYGKAGTMGDDIW